MYPGHRRGSAPPWLRYTGDNQYPIDPYDAQFADRISDDGLSEDGLFPSPTGDG